MEREAELPLLRSQREAMVQYQIAERGITAARVLDAMKRVPRHLFVHPEERTRAYEDHPLPIGHGQTISQPYMVALMTELLALAPSDRVLEIGTGSGYQTAILAELCQTVVSVERDAQLAASARERLDALGYANTTVIVGDGTLGHSAMAPYDAILVTAGGPQVPAALRRQLALDGRLVCPVGPREMQRLVVETRIEGGFTEKYDTACTFVPLIGKEGWPE